MSENAGIISEQVSFQAGRQYLILFEQVGNAQIYSEYTTATHRVVQYMGRGHVEIKDLNDPIVLETVKFIRIASELSEDAALDSLVGLAASTNRTERLDAIESLGDLRNQRATPILVRVLRTDPDSIIRCYAAQGLASCRADTVPAVLMQSLEGEKSDMVSSTMILSLGVRAKPWIHQLLDGYLQERFNSRNVILFEASITRDSTVVPKVISLFSADHDNQHRHMIAEFIASMHTPEADQFSSKLLDTTDRFSLKSAVLDSWARSGYTKGFDQVARMTTGLCDSSIHRSKRWGEVQDLTITLINAVAKLGTPAQVAVAFRSLTCFSDPFIRREVVRALQTLLSRGVDDELRSTITSEIELFE